MDWIPIPLAQSRAGDRCNFQSSTWSLQFSFLAKEVSEGPENSRLNHPLRAAQPSVPGQPLWSSLPGTETALMLVGPLLGNTWGTRARQVLSTRPPQLAHLLVTSVLPDGGPERSWSAVSSASPGCSAKPMRLRAGLLLSSETSHPVCSSLS